MRQMAKTTRSSIVAASYCARVYIAPLTPHSHTIHEKYVRKYIRGTTWPHYETVFLFQCKLSNIYDSTTPRRFIRTFPLQLIRNKAEHRKMPWKIAVALKPTTGHHLIYYIRPVLFSTLAERCPFFLLLISVYFAVALPSPNKSQKNTMGEL